MIVRELRQIQIIPGPSVEQDRVVVVFRAFDDADSEIELTKTKELNVGAQLQADLLALVTRVLEKASTETKPVVRPAQVSL